MNLRSIRSIFHRRDGICVRAAGGLLPLSCLKLSWRIFARECA